MKRENAISEFRKKYGEPELILKVPGRVNIIGEHTDYAGGDVLPFAIDNHMLFIGRNSSHSISKITAIDFDESITLSIDRNNDKHWSRYFSSCLQNLKNHEYPIKPMEISFTSTIPIGAGVSSSSAMTCGFLKMASELNQLELSDVELIKLASISENNTGVLGGIMDQTAIFKSKTGAATLINCFSKETQYINATVKNHQWLLINSGVQHNLALTDYNNRSASLKEGLQLIQAEHSEITSLRDVNKTHLDFLRMKNGLLAKRVRHFFHEQKRVHKMVKALEKEKPQKIGTLLFECHDSLQNIYEVSCEEIDFIISLLKKLDTVKGARIMGGGFGGSIICLIQENERDNIMSKITLPYYHQFNRDLSSFIVSASNGLKIVS